MSWIDGLAVTKDTVSTSCTARGPLQGVRVQAALTLFRRQKTSIQNVLANSELKVTHVVCGDSNFEFNNAAGFVNTLWLRWLHVHHVCNTQRLGSSLHWITTETM
jgi:hypothetical protein